jgi:mercuric ion transport protein
MKTIHSIFPGVWGLIGSAFAVLCCIGAPVVIGALGTIGAGFLVNDNILLPVLGFSLLLSTIGLVSAYKKRHRLWPLIAGILGIITLITGMIFLLGQGGIAGKPFIYAGLIALLIATLKNVIDGLNQHFTHIRPEHKRSHS